MSLARNAIKSSHRHLLPSCFRHTANGFTTGAGQQPAASAELADASSTSLEEFLPTPKTGLAYGKLFGINRNTLKSDILNVLDGCNLTLEDLKVDYNRTFQPIGMMVQFPSPNDFENAFRLISKKGRLQRLEKADRTQWDNLKPYDGKTVLLQGVPKHAVVDDVERFLCGCEYDASSLHLLARQGVALLRFHSQTQAMNALIMKNRNFCLNNQITVRVLQ